MVIGPSLTDFERWPEFLGRECAIALPHVFQLSIPLSAVSINFAPLLSLPKFSMTPNII